MKPPELWGVEVALLALYVAAGAAFAAITAGTIAVRTYLRVRGQVRMSITRMTTYQVSPTRRLAPVLSVTVSNSGVDAVEIGQIVWRAEFQRDPFVVLLTNTGPDFPHRLEGRSSATWTWPIGQIAWGANSDERDVRVRAESSTIGAKTVCSDWLLLMPSDHPGAGPKAA